MNSSENVDLENWKYLIDSRNLTKKERDEESEIKNAKLMQLKFQIEDYIGNLIVNSTPSFTDFLTRYVDILYSERKEFAQDINVEPLTLSHILDGNRDPNESFLKSLIGHSQSSFKELGGFDKELWPILYSLDKTSGSIKK